VSIHKPLPCEGYNPENYMKIKTAMCNGKLGYIGTKETFSKILFKLIADKHKNICGGFQWNDVTVPV
jgi:hypothetical protein